MSLFSRALAGSSLHPALAGVVEGGSLFERASAWLLEEDLALSLPLRLESMGPRPLKPFREAALKRAEKEKNRPKPTC